MLITLSILASFVGGFAKAPWWFWLLSGLTAALLATTDPERLRRSYAEVRGIAAFPLLLDDLKALSRGCLTSAAAFALGSALSWPLLV